jgi:hypothetical protein
MIFMFIFGFFIPLAIIISLSSLIVVNVKFRNKFKEQWNLENLEKCDENMIAKQEAFDPCLLEVNDTSVKRSFRKSMKLDEVQRQLQAKKRFVARLMKREYKLLRYIFLVVFFYTLAWYLLFLLKQ